MKAVNKQSLLTFLFLSLSLTGCIGEPDYDCNDHNLELRFTYPDKNNEDTFSEHISSVHLYLFDENHELVRSHYLDTHSLFDFQGIRTHIDPGTYYIICWGNLSETHSPINPTGKHLSGYYYTHGSSLTSTSYYGPSQNKIDEYNYLSVTIPENGIGKQTVPFMESHRSITVTVENFSDTNTNGNLPPVIEITDLAPGYNFQLTELQERISYSQNAGFIDNKTARSRFFSPFGEITNNMEVKLYKQSTNSLTYTLNIKELLDTDNTSVKPTDNIDIHITFIDGYVKATIQGWTSNDTTIEF